MLAVLFALAEVATEPKPLTFRLGLGAAVTYHRRVDRLELRPGVAPLSLGLGAFVAPRWAVLARVGGTNYTDGADVRMSGAYGAQVQFWWLDHAYVGAGLGLAMLGRDDLKFYRKQDWSVFPDAEKDLRFGFSSSVSFGYVVFARGRHTLQFELELFPSMFATPPHLVVGQGLQLQWQFFRSCPRQ